MHRGRHSGLWDAKSKVIVHLTRQQMSLCLSVVYLSVFCYAGTLLTMTVTYDNETPDHDKDVYLLAYDDDSLHTLFDSKSSSYDFSGDVHIGCGVTVGWRWDQVFGCFDGGHVAYFDGGYVSAVLGCIWFGYRASFSNTQSHSQQKRSVVGAWITPRMPLS